MKFNKLYLNLTGEFSGTFISEDRNLIKIKNSKGEWEEYPFTDNANYLNEYYGKKERRINRIKE